LLPILRCSSISVAFICEFEFIRNDVMIIQKKEENFKKMHKLIQKLEKALKISFQTFALFR